MALAITNDNFEDEVLKSDIPVLLDFWAEWCPPCKMIGPIIDSLAEAHKEKVKIAKVDVDSQKELAERFSVSSIPTLILFHNGEVVTQQVGALPEPSILALIQAYL